MLLLRYLYSFLFCLEPWAEMLLIDFSLEFDSSRIYSICKEFPRFTDEFLRALPLLPDWGCLVAGPRSCEASFLN